MSPSHPPDRLLRRYLLNWVLGTMALVWCTLVGVAYYTGWHEAEEFVDGQSVSAAELLLRQPVLGAWPSAVLGPRSLHANSDAPELHVLVWEDGQLRWDSHGMVALMPGEMRPGHQTLDTQSGQSLQHWHLYVEQRMVEGGHLRTVAVLIDTRRHKALARDIAEHIVRPALLLLPVVWVLLIWAIGRGLLPLRQLTQQIDALDSDTGQTLPEGQRFQELRAIVNAINSLVARLQAQVQRERRFASDVAHELRTPLTAIVWQARLAREAATAQERSPALQQVEQDALRAGHILAQLLELARAQGLNPADQAPLDLGELARQVLAAHAQAAHESGHELALSAPEQPVWVTGHVTMLELALRNLVENALRHTPVGTQVEVTVWQDASGGTVLSVSDDGARDAAPGSAPSSASPGLGIGLTLVQRIATWHRIGFERGVGEPPFTTRFALVWPPGSAAPPGA